MSVVTARNRNAGQYYKNGKKKPPNWEYRFEGLPIDGHRNQISKAGFKTKAEAEIEGLRVYNEYMQSAEKKVYDTKISVSDYLDEWFEKYCKVELKYTTQVGYAGIIENHLKTEFGKYNLTSITPSMLTDYATKLVIRGYSKSHIVGILSTFSSALNYAVSPMKYIKENPMRYYRTPKAPSNKKEIIILKKEDFDEILDRFPYGNRFHVMLMLGWHCGLRISETCGLTWDDIDFKKKTLTVNRQTVKRNLGTDVHNAIKGEHKKAEKSAWYFTTPKYESVRVVHLGNTILQYLKEEHLRQLENEIQYGEYYTTLVAKKERDEMNQEIIRILPVAKVVGSNLPRINMVCVDENGDFTSSDSFKYCSRVIHYGLKMKFNYHALRHTHGTMLIANGVSPKIVQVRLGHKNIETTLQTYVHATEEMQEEAMEIFDQVINGSF